jgi:NAD(P)-dependent dehydrogenase (short-subunit alcohol dehydrogenase family)
MKIEGATCLVTGANRGLGAVFVDELHRRRARRIYAAARLPESVTRTDVIPVGLDITDLRQVQRAAAECGDVALLINSAGILRSTQPISADGLDAARAEIETNYLGLLAMCRAFAPVLAANNGGALVNVLSAVSWFAPPMNGTYAASKAAAWLLTHSVRRQLAGQGTQVVAVHASFIDTEMIAHLDVPKTAPGRVVEQTLDAVEEGRPEVLADARTREVKAALSNDLELIYGLSMVPGADLTT